MAEAGGAEARAAVSALRTRLAPLSRRLATLRGASGDGERPQELRGRSCALPGAPAGPLRPLLPSRCAASRGAAAPGPTERIPSSRAAAEGSASAAFAKRVARTALRLVLAQVAVWRRRPSGALSVGRGGQGLQCVPAR